ncbi:inactive tyrosine-protein kinase 7-like, partial [Haliotis cracherodii]|uniref:inactive tyrosine-protein kinase 7-like n=1 Tax=Haliotis cracherodii TaxID=6455 RepID=UPI0039EAFD31
TAPPHPTPGLEQSNTATGTSLTLTQTHSQAFLGLTLQLKCDVTTVNRQPQALLFQMNTVPKCTVKVDDCTQYTRDADSQTQYTCGCGQQSDGNYVYILNASSLHDDVEGNWRCEYDEFSNTIHVNLTDPEGPTQIQMDKTEPQPKEGGSVNLTCSANCLPDCRYSWTKGGQDLASRTRGSRGQVLALRGVVGNDSGNYTCTAVNPSSNKASNISAFLLVQTSPKRKVDAPFSPTLKTATGQTAKMEVTFSGDPRLVSWWKIESGSLTPVNNSVGDTEREDIPGRVDGSLTAVLEVKVETDDDLGMYCVSAENIIDTTFVYIDLQGEGDFDEDARCHSQTAVAEMSILRIAVGAGAAAMLLVITVVAVVFCRKYKEMKRALDCPYASTQRLGNAVVDSNHYQELPSPQTLRKQLLEGGYTLPTGGTGGVFSTKVDMKPVDGTHPISKTNPIYDHIHDDNIMIK